MLWGQSDRLTEAEGFLSLCDRCLTTINIFTDYSRVFFSAKSVITGIDKIPLISIP
ncbi:hypothetical protein NG799_18400 [Laspinema sp. D1]|uniref:Uncharacterized protein n=1 Tax=Laspinema palackyanum D2a TaxID=2953684 RepID=A0ABT2MU64_9CYAN|nr:hypothetical protein [Laspinema sp. D2a]